MKIGIDARMYRQSGIGRYIRNLIANLQLIDQENQYYIFLQKEDFDSLKLAGNFHPVLADFPWYGFAEQLKFPPLLKKYQLDVVHFPHFNVPIFYSGQYIVTIHDLIHQHFQLKEATIHNYLTYQIKKIGFEKIFLKALSKSDKIITPSNFVKEQLINEWRVKRDKIMVTYEGVEGGFLKLLDELSEKDFLKLSAKFGFKKPYLFYVGNAYPHKNIHQLIKAFTILKNDWSGLNLVLSGPESHFYKFLKQSTKIKEVIFTGPVSDRELVVLYKNARAYVFPSLEEGFGIPLLEAMASGCPVVCSKAGSLPEVGGEAAFYFDPQDTEDMVLKIKRVLTDEKLRKELIRKGERRYKLFDWSKMAKQTLDIYKEVTDLND